MTADLIDIMVGNVVWATIAKGGPCHAADTYWADENSWLIRCNRRGSYTDMQLHALDNDPTDKVCTNPACQRAHRAWQRLYGETRR